ncbi:unnamed protein product [Citrullus colocynthis]|uniref:Uncharacterized protein n=1 Tax=Citrullus colocynthis TaxID=252529 RepID=A0ABP0Z148_9ROSI
MSPETSKSHKIRRIVRLRQMLQHWRKKARAAANRAPPADVPAGHVAVCVGSDCRRFIVRATFLNHPIFRKLLSQAEEEYGFETRGPLALPCDESVFEEVLRVVARSELSNSSRHSNLKDLQRRCDEDVRIKNLEFLGESRPLLLLPFTLCANKPDYIEATGPPPVRFGRRDGRTAINGCFSEPVGVESEVNITLQRLFRITFTD